MSSVKDFSLLSLGRVHQVFEEHFNLVACWLSFYDRRTRMSQSSLFINKKKHSMMIDISLEARAKIAGKGFEKT
jgi:hypothetical protein